MKLIDYARSPLHRRADTARSFHARRWKEKPMDAFSSARDLAHFYQPPPLTIQIPFLFPTLVFDV